MDLWDLKCSRRLSWTPELESVFAVFCRKFAFDFAKVSRAMIRYAARNCNGPEGRLVDPFHFTPDVCRVHWSFRDYKRRQAQERAAFARRREEEEEDEDEEEQAAEWGDENEGDDQTEEKDVAAPPEGELREQYNAIVKEAEAAEADDDEAQLKLLESLLSHASKVFAKDKTQQKDAPTFAQMQQACETAGVVEQPSGAAAGTSARPRMPSSTRGEGSAAATGVASGARGDDASQANRTGGSGGGGDGGAEDPRAIAMRKRRAAREAKRRQMLSQTK